jgi:Acetyltransferases, including N-acetylases of ribosomal proteins
MLVIETERLVLRDFRQTDLHAYQALRLHPDFQRFCSEDDAAPANADYLLNMFIAQAAEMPRTKFQLAIEIPSEKVIGSCGIRITSADEKQGSFGCELGQAYWGKGYAYEAARAVIGFGFTDLDLHRIYAETISENLPAVALAKRLGMQVEGELRENRRFKGRWWNTVILSILKSEWR